MADLTEGLVSDTLNCFLSFPLQHLDAHWVNDLWMNQFSSLEDYPPYETNIFCEKLFEPILNCIKICEKWIEKSSESHLSEADSMTDEERDTVLWTVLLDNDIEIKLILGFLYAVCHRSIKPGALMYEREMGLKCAKLYFTLLRIPGNMAYSVYHPSLFQLAFDCFKFPKEKVQGKKRPPTSAYRNDIVSKRKRTRREDDDSFSESPEEPLATEDVDILNERELNPRECDDVLMHFIDVLKSIIPLFQTFSLNNNFELIEHIVRKLGECVAVESRHTDFNFSRSVDEICSLQRRNGISYVVTALGYCAYSSLCQALHGDVQEIYRLCLQSLYGHILCLKAKSQPNQVITHKHIVIKDNAVAFVCYNLDKHIEFSSEVSRILIQRLCIRCCDKTDYRSKVASGILTVLKHLPLKAYVEIIDWFVRFVTQKPQDKLIILEILSLLITEPEREVTSEITEKWTIYVTHIPIVFSIIERCNDKAPTVRAKALAVLTSALKRIIDVRNQVSSVDLASPDDDEMENEERDDNQNNPDITDKGEVANIADEENADRETAVDKEGETAEESEPAPEEVQRPAEKHVKERKPSLLRFKMCTVERLVDVLILRSMDFKVHVRKAALQALETLLCLDEAYVTEKFLTFLSRGTRDPNVTVRKSSVSSLTVILHKYYCNTLVQKFWLKNVLPVVLDAEKSVQSKSLEEMEPLFLLNYGSSPAKKDCTWTMLSEIACGGHNDLLRYLQKAYGIWNTEGKLKNNLSHILEKELGSEHDPAVWMLLSILSSNIEIRNVTMIINRWEQSWKEEVENSARLRMLQAFGHASKHMKTDQLRHLQAMLENQIRSFNCHFQLISSTIETLHKIYRAQSKGEDAAERLMNNFAVEVIQVLRAKFHCIEREICTMLFNSENCPIEMSETPQPTENFMSELIMEQNSSEKYSEDMICQFLHTLGELALLAPRSIPKNMVLILQSIIASTSEPDINMDRPSTSDDRSNKVWRPSPKIQAFSFLTLGKLCLTNEEYPESCLPVFIRELATSKSFIVRMNIVTALADLCVRYTLMVDLYIPSISVCLKDASVNIRCQTLALISRLLQEDYIKLKDSLLYRLLAVLIDPDEDMRNMVEYCLGSLLVKRHPTVFVQHFVETIFYFNSCSSVPGLRANQQEPDIKLFSLKGRKNFEKRNTIYKFITKHTPALKRLQIVTKLSEDILNAVASQTMSLDSSVEAVIKDCLVVLSSDEIKPSQGQSNSGDDNDESESTDSIACKATYRNAVVFAVIPIAITLKKTLLEAKSPLVSNVLQFIGEICKDYKNEVKDAFASNKAIIEEIEFITKKYEKEHEKKAHNRNREMGVDTYPPRTRSGEDPPLNQSIVNNGTRPLMQPVLVLRPLSLERGQAVDVSVLMNEIDDVPTSSSHRPSQNNHQTSVRRTASNGRMPLAETEEILSQEANERNIANGNITVCDIGNSEWDDTRRSLHSTRTPRSGHDEN